MRRAGLISLLTVLAACATVPAPVPEQALTVSNRGANGLLPLSSGGFVAYTYSDQSLTVYDSAGKMLRSTKLRAKLVGPFALLPKTDVVALTRSDEPTTIHIVDVAKGTELRRFRLDEGSDDVDELQWAAGGTLLLVKGMYHFDAYDTVTGAREWGWKGETVLFPAVTPSGKRVAVISKSKGWTLLLVDVRTGEITSRIALPEGKGEPNTVDWLGDAVLELVLRDRESEPETFRRVTVDVGSGKATLDPAPLPWSGRDVSWFRHVGNRLRGTGVDAIGDSSGEEDIVEVWVPGRPLRRFRIDGYIYTVAQGNGGRVLVGTSRGIFVLDAGVPEPTASAPENLVPLVEAAEGERRAIAESLAKQPPCSIAESDRIQILDKLQAFGRGEGSEDLESAIDQGSSCPTVPIASELIFVSSLLFAKVEAAKAQCSLPMGGMAENPLLRETQMKLEAVERAPACSQVLVLERKKQKAEQAVGDLPTPVLLAIVLDAKTGYMVKNEARNRLRDRKDLDAAALRYLDTYDLPSLIPSP